MKCGSTFWIHGNLEGDGLPFGDHILLNKLASQRPRKDDGLPCEMFQLIGNKTFCSIQKYAGLKYKPMVCREFPEPGEECFFSEKPIEKEKV